MREKADPHNDTVRALHMELQELATTSVDIAWDDIAVVAEAAVRFLAEHWDVPNITPERRQLLRELTQERYGT